MFGKSIHSKKNSSLKYPHRLAIIDLGTNSVRSGIFEISEWMKVKRISRHKKMIRLGDGVYKTGNLSEEALIRALEAFKEIKKEIEDNKVNQIICYATSAMRSAKNCNKLKEIIKSKTNIDIEIIPGEQEAQLIAKGILHAQNTPNEIFALVDIGGGSTEISICHHKRILDSCSFDLGANRLQQIFLKKSPPQPSENIKNPVKELRQHVKEIVSSVKKERNWPQINIVIGSSGTIKAFKRIIKKNKGAIDPFLTDALSTVVHKLTPLSKEKILKIDGMDPRRVDIIVAGGILFEEILRVIGARRVFTSSFSLRDGILEEQLEKHYFATH